jgi:hypothetical protein
MKSLFLIATAIATIASATTNKADACNLRLPTFEVMGFPISPHQVAVLGSAHVKERSARPTLMLAGMPASPHQIAVLTPRKAAKITDASAQMAVPADQFRDINLSPIGRGILWPHQYSFLANVCVPD